jgi:hypothetical protein
MRVQVISATAWRLVSDLVRRQFTRYKLRVLDVHLGERPPDCIAIYLAEDHFPGTPLCHFNRSGSLRIASPSKKVVSRKENYAESFLRMTDPWKLVDHIEAQIGLSAYKGETLPGTTRPVLILRLISGLLDRFITSKAVLEARCGWLQSLGSLESHMRDDLLLFPSAAQTIRERLNQGMSKAQASYDHWLLYTKDGPPAKNVLRALLDPQGKVWFPHEDPWDAWQEFKKARRKVLPLINHLHAALL